MTERNPRAHVNRSSEAGDAQGLATQLLCFFNFRAGHQILDERINSSPDNHDVSPAQGRARCRAAGYLQELHFAGDQGVHPFDAGGRSNDFHF